MTPLDRQTIHRLIFVFAAFAGFALVLVVRLGYWQLMSHPELQAADTASRLQPAPIRAGRGSIYDSTGRLLAGDVIDYYVTADPRAITNPADTAAKLSKIIARPEAELRAALDVKD